MSGERTIVIKEGLKKTQARITQACQQYQRTIGDVRLLTVSKRWPASDLRLAYQQGMRCFGESYLKEAIDKIGQLKDLDIEWHFIGPVQSNKTRLIAENFSWLHSLYSIKHAKRINEQRPADLPPINACLQINISNEASKSGLLMHEALDVALEIQKLSQINLRGLMAIPAPCDDISQQRAVFHQLHDLKTQLNHQGFNIDTLSMGMSNDLEAAIAEGANIVRIGRAIFGTRR